MDSEELKNKVYELQAILNKMVLSEGLQTETVLGVSMELDILIEKYIREKLANKPVYCK